MITALFLVLTSAWIVTAQVKTAEPSFTFEDLKRLRAAAATEAPGRTPCEGWELPVQQECVAAYAEYFKYEKAVLGQRQATYAFQLLSTKVILFVVVLLVLAGLTFAAIQFWYALIKVPAIIQPMPKQANAIAQAVAAVASSEKPPDAQALNMDLTSNLELSTTGFKVQSSILGLLLVLISMGFFFLYIRYVYPIEEGGPRPQSQETLSPPRK